MDEQDKLLAEFEYWLHKEDIDLSPERRLHALADFIDVRKHVEVVARATESESEPSMVFVLRSSVPRT